MVSSHVTLKSCGLFVANSLGEIVELTVRELTTPLHMQGDIFINSIELPDYARAALDMRSVSELGDRVQNIVIDWKFLFTFTSISIVGIFIGIYLNKYVNEVQLKKGFAYFVLLMAIFILFKEF
jgi:hypothetical protein